MIRVVIADDHHLVRSGIRALLEKADDIDVIGEAVDGHAAVEMVAELEPDVLIMDINMPRLNGVQATEQIMALHVPTQIVILSMYSDDIVIRQVLQHGAKGYLLKGSVTEELLLAVRSANQSAAYLSRAISEKLAGALSAPPGLPVLDPVEQLTPREKELVQLIGEGHTNSEIAGLLNISVKTVERHRTNLMSKLNVRNLVELIRVAIKYGLIRMDE